MVRCQNELEMLFFINFLAEYGPLSPVVQPLWHTLVAALVTLHSDPLICCNCHDNESDWKQKLPRGARPNGCGQVAYVEQLSNYVVRPNLIFFGHESGTVLQQASPWSQGVLKWSGSKPQGSCKSSPPQVFGQLNKQFIGKIRRSWPWWVTHQINNMSSWC